MAKHTPGPWGVWQGETIYAGPAKEKAPGLLSGYRGHICEMSDMDFHGDELKANARLIAASPDLLEACQAALPYVEHFLGGWSAHTRADICSRELFEQLRAAIEKATVPQPDEYEGDDDDDWDDEDEGDDEDANDG